MFAQTTSSATVTAISAPASYLVIDIETGHAPETAIQAAINSWKPAASAKTEAEVNAEAEQAIASWSPPSNIRDASKIEERRVAALAKIESDRVANLEKIVERKAEAVAKIRDKSALLDSAPILCIGVQTQHGAVVFNGMSTDNFPIGGVQCLGCGDEKDMLVIFRQWIDIYTDQSTVIVGQNVRGFDLPKLRSAFMRYHIKLPALLAPKIIAGEQQSIVDTAFLFKSFSVEHRDDFCPSLDSICTGLGIPRPKGVISGAAVPNLHKEGRYQEILTYNAIDVAATTRAYLLMSGQADDLT